MSDTVTIAALEGVTTELPVGWTWTKVGDLAQLLRGVTYKKHDASPQPAEGYAPLLRANNINGKLNFDELVYVPLSKIDEQQFVKAQDIVIAMSSGSKHLVGKAAQATTDLNLAFGAFCGVVRPTPIIDKQYVGAFFQSDIYRKTISRLSGGSNINNLKREHVLEMPFPLPPLNEQHRIVEKIEELFTKLDHGVDALKKTQVLLKRYRQSVLKASVEGELSREWREAHGHEVEPASLLLARILQERKMKWEQSELHRLSLNGKTPHNDRWSKKYKEPAKTDLVELPELPGGWLWVSLESLADIIPPNPSHRMPIYVQDGFPFVSSENFIEADGLNFRIGKQVTESTVVDQENRYQVENGDFVLSRIGTIGKTRFLPTDQRYALSHALVVVKAYSSEINRRFLRYAISSDTVLRQAHAGIQSVGVPDLGMGKIRAFAVPLLDSKEQEFIVNELEKHLSVIVEIEASVLQELKRSNRLRQSILKQAFSGKLVPQDPTDEPATVLLERIKTEKSPLKNNKQTRLL